MQDDKILIHAVIDIGALERIITDALKIEDAPELFEKLSEIAMAKSMLADAKEALDKVEGEAKSLINSRAKELYGPDWQAIKGRNFKISRSRTGAKYEHTDAAEERFIKVKLSVDSDAVDNYVKENNKLPEGIAPRQGRGESIRIKVGEVTDDDATDNS